MYVPKQFQENRIERLAEAIREIQLGTLVTGVEAVYHTSHIPMIFKRSAEGMFLEGHVARPNQHWTIVKEPRPSIAVFMGPQAYISPSWYETKREHGKVVPTWNYLVVHVEGSLSAIENHDWLLAHLNELTKLNETHRKDPWGLQDAPDGFIESLSRGVVGLRLAVQNIIGCWKMAQHRSEGDRSGAIAGLLDSAEPANQRVAGVMQSLEEDLK